MFASLGCSQQRNLFQRAKDYQNMVLSLVHACYIYIVCIHVDVPVYPLLKALGVIPLIAETK